MRYPKLYRARQSFPRPRLEDLEEILRRKLAVLEERVKPGQSVAVAVGSRGIRDIKLVTKCVVERLKELGLEVFVVPAMGSHGGATPEGQRQILSDYGITEKEVGAPVRATMEVEKVGETEDGVPVLVDAEALGADWLIPINRVKPHTHLSGEIESGLSKMLLIGIGNHAGATVYHRAVVKLRFMRLVRTAVPVVLERARVLCGVAIVENAYDETCEIDVVTAEVWFEREAELQSKSKSLMPRLPLPELDVLIVDFLGKDISGAGMDTNIIGREKPVENITNIFVRDMTPNSHGNALGLGYADITTEKLIKKVDWEKTYINCVAACSLLACKTPVVYPSEREALEVALKSVGLIEPSEVSLVWIKSTLHIYDIVLSERAKEMLGGRGDIKVATRPFEFEFSGDELVSPFGSGI